MRRKLGMVTVGNLPDGLAVFLGDIGDRPLGHVRCVGSSGDNVCGYPGASGIWAGLIACPPQPRFEFDIMNFLKPFGLDPTRRVE